MSTGLFVLIVNLVLLFFVLMGFLDGLRKGLKKQALWLAFFTGAIILAFIFTPLITNGIIDISINISGESQSIRDYIVSLITQNEIVGGMYVEGSSFAGVVDNFPIMIANLVVFVLALYIFLFIMWIAYLIVSAIVFRKKKNKALDSKVYTIKEGQAVELIDVKPKKHRLLGSLIGIVCGFVLCFFTLLPISGIVGIYTDASNAEVVYADDGESQTAVQKLLNGYIPEEYRQYIDAYNGTIINVLGGVIGFDDICFNSLASMNVNGNKIVLRNEIVTYAEVYDSIEFLTTLDFNNMVWKDLDFKRLNKAVDLLFESQLFRSLSSEILPYALNYVQTSDILDNNEYKEQILELCNALEVGFADNYQAEILKSDFKAILGVFETICTTGIMDELTEQTINLNNVLDTLVADNCKNLNDILNNFFQSTSVKSLLVGAINIGLGELEKTLPEGTNLDRIDITKVDWSQFKTEVNTIVQSGVEVYKDLENSDYSIEQIKNQPKLIYNLDYKGLVREVFKILDTASKTNLFTKTVNGTNIYDNILNAYKDSEIGKYVNLDVFKSNNNFSWSEESDVLINLLEEAKPLILQTENFKTIDYTSLKASVNGLFDSKLLDAVNMDILDNLSSSTSSIEDDDVKNLIDGIITDMQDKSSFRELEQDVMSLLDVLEICGKAELIDQLIDGNVNFAIVVKKLDEKTSGKTGYELLIESFLSSPILKNTFTNAMNVVLGTIEKGLEVTLSRVSLKTQDWSGWQELESGVITMFKELSEVVKAYEGEELKFDITMLDENFISCLENFGGALDAFATLPIWNYSDNGNEKNIYDDIITFLENKEGLGEYINFAEASLDNFVNGEFWKPELVAYKSSLERLISKKITINGEEKNLLNALLNGYDIIEVIKTFTTVDTINGTETVVNDVDTIMKPLLERKLFKKLTVMMIDEINFQVEKITNENVTPETSTLTKISLDTDLALQSNDILSVIKCAIDAITIENPEISDYRPLLDAMKINAEANYNGENGVFKEVYSLLEAYVNSEVKGAIADNFGLNQDVLDSVGDISLDTLLDVAETATDVIDKISDGTVTSEDVNSLVDKLTNSEVQEIVETIANNGGSITLPENIKQDVASYVQGSDISEDLKNKLSSIFGVGV